MTRKPATTAAQYLENTRDDNKQRELHPADCGSLDLGTFSQVSHAARRAAWAAASDADKRGLAIQAIRRGNHGPTEELIATYLDILESKFGLSEVEHAVVGALQRLAASEAQSARTARDAQLKDDAKFFQRAANAYSRALGYYLDGIRPTPIREGWLLPSQRAGEAPHLLTKDGDWICSCASGQHIHWASALIIGIEVGYDDLAQLAEPVEAAIPEGTDDDDFSDVPAGPGEPARARLDDPALITSLVQRLAAKRMERQVAA